MNYKLKLDKELDKIDKDIEILKKKHERIKRELKQIKKQMEFLKERQMKLLVEYIELNGENPIKFLDYVKDFKKHR